MSAAILNLRWDDLVNGQVPAVASKNPGLFCRVRVQPQAHRCPYCDSIVYSRRHSRCGLCAQVLPEECLFTVSEAEKVEMLVKTELQRHRAWLKKKEKV